MPYCLLADLGLTERELILLTDDMVPPVMVVAEEVDKAIAYADMLINAHVGERYALPFTAVPELVKTIAVDLATWKLFYRKKKDKLPEAVQKAYDNSMKLLGQIRDGKIGIGVTPAGGKVEPEAGTIQVAGSAAIFTKDSLERY
jgi:phage gp36-like protein